MKSTTYNKSKSALGDKETSFIKGMAVDSIEDTALNVTTSILLPTLVTTSFKNPTNISGAFGNVIGTMLGIPTFDSAIAGTLVSTAGKFLGPIGSIAVSTIAPVITDAIMDATDVRSYESVRDAYEECYDSYVDGRRAGTYSVSSLDLSKEVEANGINYERFAFDHEAQALLDYIRAVSNGVPKEIAVKLVNAHLDSKYTYSEIDTILRNKYVQVCLSRYSAAVSAILEYEQNKSILDRLRGAVGMDNNAVEIALKAINYAELGPYTPIKLEQNFNTYLQQGEY